MVGVDENRCEFVRGTSKRSFTEHHKPNLRNPQSNQTVELTTTSNQFVSIL